MDHDTERAREAVAKMDRRQRAAYIWSYNWGWFAAAAAAAVLIVFGVRYAASHPRTWTMVQATLVNADTLEAERSTFFADFAAAQGYDADEKVGVEAASTVHLDTQDARSASSFQVLAAELASGEIDLFVSEEDLFAKEMERSAFQSLEGLLPGSTLEQYSDRLVYAGQVPVGIRLADTQLVRDGVYRNDQKVVAGISAQAENPEEAAALLLRLLASEQ